MDLEADALPIEPPCPTFLACTSKTTQTKKASRVGNKLNKSKPHSDKPGNTSTIQKKRKRKNGIIMGTQKNLTKTNSTTCRIEVCAFFCEQY